MTKPWVKVLEKVQLFERAHSQNESNTESSGFKINFTECKFKRLIHRYDKAIGSFTAFHYLAICWLYERSSIVFIE